MENICCTHLVFDVSTSSKNKLVVFSGTEIFIYRAKYVFFIVLIICS